MTPLQKSIPFLINTSLYKNHKTITFAVAIVASWIFDLLLGLLVSKFELSLFLEGFFVAVLTFCFGLIPGLISGGFYNLIKCIFFHTSFVYGLYGLNGICLALIIWLFYKRETLYPEFLHILFVYILVVITQSFVGSFVNNLIEFIPKYGIDWDSFSWFKTILIAQGMPVHLANFLGRVPLNLISQIIVVSGGYGFSRVLEYVSYKSRFLK